MHKHTCRSMPACPCRLYVNGNAHTDIYVQVFAYTIVNHRKCGAFLLKWYGSMLQCDAVCCRVLQCVAVCCSVLQCTCVHVYNPVSWSVRTYPRPYVYVHTYVCVYMYTHVHVYSYASYIRIQFSAREKLQKNKLAQKKKASSRRPTPHSN